MIKTSRLFIAAFAAITALSSCAKAIDADVASEPQEADGLRVISIAYDSETKTAQNYDWHMVHFVDGDKIKVMGSSGSETCTVNITDGAASFSTSLTGELTAVYPPECGSQNFRTGKITVATYPPYFQDGTLASGHIASATIASGSTKVVFHNETALLRIITPAGTKQLTVASASELISDGEIMDGGISNDAKKSIVVGDGTKELGTCYVSIHPGANLNGITFDAGIGTKTVSSNVVTKAGVAYTISNEDWSISVIGIILDRTSLIMETGDRIKITSTLEPSNATNQQVHWSSTNESIAKVYSGNGHATVEAVSLGKATITATTDDGSKTATCTVYVKGEALSGIFSVSATKKVKFSRGNLQAIWDGSQYEWNFAVNQYDYNDADTQIYPQTEGAVIDLFGWSTAANYYGINTSAEMNSYKGTFIDWGTTIDNEGTWRTLTVEECQYLFSAGDYANSTCAGRYAHHVTVAGKTKCIVLYPDGYSGEIVKDGDKTSYNTTEKWVAAEIAGAVCLPAGGRRHSHGCLAAGDLCKYWTSTAYDDEKAYQVASFEMDDNLYSGRSEDRIFGCSVRLVTDVK